MEQAIINVEGTTTIETAAAAKKLIGMLGNQNVRAISVNRVNDKSDEVIVELDFVPGLAPHLHGFTLQVNGLTCGYAGTGPSNLYEVLQAAGVSEAQVAREDITQKSTKNHSSAPGTRRDSVRRLPVCVTLFGGLDPPSWRDSLAG